jgi:hypothetical protein
MKTQRDRFAIDHSVEVVRILAATFPALADSEMHSKSQHVFANWAKNEFQDIISYVPLFGG